MLAFIDQQTVVAVGMFIGVNYLLYGSLSSGKSSINGAIRSLTIQDEKMIFTLPKDLFDQLRELANGIRTLYRGGEQRCLSI